MKLTTGLEVLLYLFLLALSLLFVWENIEEYLEGKKIYSVSQEPVTLHDLPTITICWKFGTSFTAMPQRATYGKDFTIDVKILDSSEETTVTLKENKSVETRLFAIAINLNEMWSTTDTNGVPCLKERDKQCFKITSMWPGFDEINVKTFRQQFAFKFSNHVFENAGYEASSVVFTYFSTSEENSYGLAWGRRFEGTTDCRYLYTGNLFKLVDISEYHNMEPCYEDSYYSILAQRFTKVDSNRTITASECQSVQKCTPFSLPFDAYHIPVCKHELDRVCNLKVIEDLRSDLTGRACKMKEYKIEDEYLGLLHMVTGQSENTIDVPEWTTWIVENWDMDGKKPSNTLIFEQAFELPRELKQWTNAPFKTIYTEVETTSFLALLGSIGGTMGMFVGFSLIGSTGWFTTILWAWVKRRIQSNVEQP